MPVIPEFQPRFNTHYLNADNLRDMGANVVGDDVAVSATCTLVGVDHMTFVEPTRVDSYALLVAGADGPLAFAGFTHIGTRVSIYGGKAPVTVSPFATISAGSILYTGSDDFSGRCLSGPFVPADSKGGVRGPIFIGRHVIVGAQSTMLPSSSVGYCAAVGAQSFVPDGINIPDCEIWAGTPARKIGRRQDAMTVMEQDAVWQWFEATYPEHVAASRAGESILSIEKLQAGLAERYGVAWRHAEGADR